MPEIKKFIAALQAKYAAHYGVDIEAVAKGFALNGGTQLPTNEGEFTPSKEILLLLDVAKLNQFLSLVNMYTRQQKQGGSFRIGPQGRNTRTNDTKAGDERRLGQTQPPTLNEYQMVKQHFDWMMHDDDISDMSEFPNWRQAYRQAMLTAYGNDIQVCGFHGVEYQRTSNLSDNPLLEDVNKGWLQLMRERNASNIHTGNENGEVHIGKDGHYANLDHFVQDLYQGIPQHKRSPGMTAVVGEDLIAHAEASYFSEQGMTPTEKGKLSLKTIMGIYGGLEAIKASYFPLNMIMITPLKRNGNGHANLSMYTQRGSMKRAIEYKNEKEALIDWNKSYRAYHIEDIEQIVMTELNKVVFLDVKDSQGNPVEIVPLPANKWADL